MSTKFLLIMAVVITLEIFYLSYLLIIRDQEAERRAQELNCKDYGAVGNSSKIRVFECNNEVKLIKVE